jgi:urease beta subunit
MGEEKQVTLIAFGGLRRIFGHQGKINGSIGSKK